MVLWDRCCRLKACRISPAEEPNTGRYGLVWTVPKTTRRLQKIVLSSSDQQGGRTASSTQMRSSWKTTRSQSSPWSISVAAAAILSRKSTMNGNASPSNTAQMPSASDSCSRRGQQCSRIHWYCFSSLVQYTPSAGRRSNTAFASWLCQPPGGDSLEGVQLPPQHALRAARSGPDRLDASKTPEPLPTASRILGGAQAMAIQGHSRGSR